MRPHRIFRPAPGARHWGKLLLGCAAVAGALILATALPRELFGSAPTERLWSAGATEVRVVDADTLRLVDRILRLEGLMVPDRGQARCPAAQGGDCAAGAAEVLAGLVQGAVLECRIRGQDRLGRALGSCRAAGIELNTALVAAGWALAAGDGFRASEATARQQGLGLWAAGVAWPEAWQGRR